MSEEISVLGIAVETRGAKEGSEALDRLAVSGGKAEKSVNSLGGESKRSSSEISALAKSALAAGAAFASFASIKAIASSMIETSDAMSLMAARLKLVTSSQAEFAAVQSRIISMADENRAGIAEMSALYTRLAAPIKEAGGGMKETISIVDSFSKSLKIGGASAQEAAAATLQFAQAMGSGKLSGDEFRSLAEASPRFMKAIADSVGVPVGALKEMATQGQLTADVVGNALIKANAALSQEFKSLPTTVADSMTQVRNELKLVVDDINKASGATSGLSGAINDFSSYIQPIGSILVEASRGMKSTGDSAGAMDVAIQGLRVTLETLIVAGSNVGYVLNSTGREIGGIAAQITALASGDFKGFSAIGGMMKTDAEEARKSIDEYSARILGAYEKTKAGSKQTAESVASDTKASLRSISSISAYLADMSNAPKSVKISAEIEKENGSFRAAIASLKETDADYVETVKKITKAHNERIAEIQKQPNATAKSISTEYAALFAYSDEMTRISKELETDLKAITKANDEYAKSIEKKFAPLETEAANMEEQLKNYGLTRAEIEATTLARLEEERAMLAINDGSAVLIANLDREISARKRIKEASEGIDAKKAFEEAEKASEKAAEKAADDWNKSSEKIGDSITDALMRGFESGKGFAETLRDTVVNMFKTMVLKPVIQATVMGGLSAMGMGSAMAGDTSAGMGWSTGNIASSANSAYNLFSGGGSGLYGAFATSGLGTALGLSTGTLAGSAASAYSGGSILAGNAIGSGGALTSLGSTIGAAIPWVGVAAAVASMLMKDGGGPKSGGDAYMEYTGDTASTMDRARLAALMPNLGGNSAGTGYYTPNNSDATASSLLATVGQSIGDSIKKLGGTANGLKIGLGFDTDPNGTAGSRVQSGVYRADGSTVFDYQRDIGKDGDISAAMVVELQRINLAAIQAAEGIKPIFKEIASGIDLTTATAEQMTQALTDIQGVVGLRTAFETLNFGADNLSTSIIKAAGGITTLQSNLNSYYTNYFTAEEQKDNTLKTVTKALADVGQTVPATRAEFKALTEQFANMGPAGETTFSALMSVQGAFASITESTDALAQAAIANAKTTAEAAATAKKAADDLLASIIESATTAAESAFSATKSLADEAASAAESAVSAALEGVQTAIDAEKARVNAAFETDSAAINSRIATLKSLDSQLKQAINSSYTPSFAGYQMAQNGLALAAKNMQGGVLPDSNALAQLIYRSKANTDWFTTEADMMRAQAKTDEALSSLSSSTSGQMSIAEQSLVAITSQRDATIKSLDDQMAAAKSQVNALHGIDSKALSIGESLDVLNATSNKLREAWVSQAQAAVARKQLDELQGINSGVNTLVGAFQTLNQSIYALAQATGKAATVPVSDYAGTNGANYSASSGTWSSSAGSASTDSIKAALTDVFNKDGAAGIYKTATSVGLSLTDVDRIVGLTAGTAVAATSSSILADLQKANDLYGAQGVYDRAKALGLTLSQVDSIVGHPAGTSAQWAKDHNLPAFAGGGDHKGGWRKVGENGVEIEYTPPSHIYSNQQSKNLIDIAPLLAELKKLRESGDANNERINKAVSDISTLLDKVMPDRDAIRVRAA